jgi:hypothetical protein
MTFNENLVSAKEAVRQVQIALPKGAGNKISNLWEKGFEPAYCVDDMRKARDGDVPINTIPNISFVALQATGYKCGNCGEQSALAFMYLLNKGVSPLDIMCVVGRDHNYVVIGRENEDEGEGFGPINWGANAVICDPWYGKFYRAGDMSWQLGTKKLHWRSVYRLSGAYSPVN